MRKIMNRQSALAWSEFHSVDVDGVSAICRLQGNGMGSTSGGRELIELSPQIQRTSLSLFRGRVADQSSDHRRSLRGDDGFGAGACL